MTQLAIAPRRDRYTALDGLRGVAALVVVFMHIFNLHEGVLSIYTRNVLDHTPAALLIAGRESVSVFFVLSGFVVALPVLKRLRQFNWGTYYVSRFLRLYLPALASLLFATALLFLVPRTIVPVNWWLTRSTHDLNIYDFLVQSLFFPAGGNFPLNVPLWSLRWEMYFSLLLPLFVGAAWLLRKYWYLLFALCCIMIWYGYTIDLYQSAAQIFATFGLGTLMAVKRAEIAALFARLFKSQKVMWVASILLPTLSLWALIGYHFAPLSDQLVRSNSDSYLITSLSPLGAAGIVLCALTIPWVRNLLETGVAKFFGKISFSLYLVHVPLLVTGAYLFTTDNWALTAIVVPLLTIPSAVLFQHFVEAPLHSVARRAGKWLPVKMKALYLDVRTNGITLKKPDA